MDLITSKDAEIEGLKQYACQCEASVHSIQADYGRIQKEQIKLFKAYDELEQRFIGRGLLLTRAADALEDAPIDHAKGCPVSGICICDDGKERVNLVELLRKAVQ